MNSLRAADTAIASTISRFGARRGRPPGAASGIIGSITAHWPFVMSLG
jgi:hypothetical protein